MRAIVRGIVLAALAFAALGAFAAPVEYVRVCDSYGAGFFYIPGTDTCFNPATGESRTETAGGTWITQDAGSSGEWVGRPGRQCLPGRLVSLGTITPADLTLNSHDRYETAPLPITLADGEFISRLMIRGGFAASSRSTFCFMFFDEPTGAYLPAGCRATRATRDQSAIWSFIPIRPTPPADFTGPLKLVGAAGSEPWPLIENVTGELEAWACVRRVR